MKLKDNGLNKGSMDAVVVIPSYKEGKGIIPTLHSFAKQRRVNAYKNPIYKDINFAVFVVINNARNASEEVLESNELTAQVLDAISLDTLLIDLDLEESERDMIRDIIRTKVKFCIVDLYSEGNALEECNVGIASDIGSSVALEYLKNDDGVLIRTDADTIFDHEFMFGIVNTMRIQNIPGAEIGVDLQDTDNKEKERGFRLYEMWERMRKAHTVFYDYIDNCYTGRTHRTFKGAGIAVKASALKAVGGFPHLTGGEDSKLSELIENEVGELSKMEGLKAKTSPRVSGRIDDLGQGFSDYLNRLSTLQDDFANFKIPSYESYKVKRKLCAIIDIANSQEFDVAEWKFFVSEAFRDSTDGMELTKNQLKSLCKLAYKKGEKETVQNNKELELKIDKYLAGSLPRIPLIKAMIEFIDMILNFYENKNIDYLKELRRIENVEIGKSILTVLNTYKQLLQSLEDEENSSKRDRVLEECSKLLVIFSYVIEWLEVVYKVERQIMALLENLDTRVYKEICLAQADEFKKDGIKFEDFCSEMIPLAKKHLYGLGNAISMLKAWLPRTGLIRMLLIALDTAEIKKQPTQLMGQLDYEIGSSLPKLHKNIEIMGKSTDDFPRLVHVFWPVLNEIALWVPFIKYLYENELKLMMQAAEDFIKKTS